MSHIIVGTAGHIDHGKTSLVRALTGIDTDRLQEEKARGISIDLGFAHLDFGDGVTAGFVDVPGHERFVRNMLAGATGIDVVLFVVAADESVMPQTREHFAICRLLGIERGVVALTKADLADETAMDVARAETADLIAGSFLADAPVIAVSAVTGFGLDELRLALFDAAASVLGKDATRHFRMPVDRVFAMRGFGTVATGTVACGRASAGGEVEVYPSGQRARVRGIQSHGATVEEAIAGQRAALNLVGVDVADLHRGMVLGAAGVFRPTADFGGQVELLESSPVLRNRSPVHFHAGAAEIEGEVRLLDREEARPGEYVFARIVLQSPAVLLPGDRFVLRRFSPVETIGGGIVIDPHPKRMRRAALHAWLMELNAADGRGRLHRWASSVSLGIGGEALVARSGLRVDEIRQAGLIEVGDRFFTPASIEELRRKSAAEVAAFHARQPLAAGMPKQELRTRVLPDAPAGLLDFLLRDHKDLITDVDLIRHRAHARQLSSAEDEAERAIEEAFRRAGLAAPSAGEVLAKSGIEAKKGQTLLQGMLRDGRLVRVNADLVVHASALASLRELLTSRRGTRFGVPDFKAWTGVSRKFAIPLLEYCDRYRITRREGESRLVL
jgi:selenocysteine-specific elongation factor